jgi:hypothetical protein
MAAAAVQQPASLATTLNYHLEPHRGGAEVWCPGTVQDKRRPHDHQDVTVTNIRGRESEFSLDVQGFQIGPFKSSVNDVKDDQEFRGQYYDDVVAHVQKA